MRTLAPGGNAPLTSHQPTIRVVLNQPGDGLYAAIAWMPADSQRLACGETVVAGAEMPDWIEPCGDSDCRIDLDRLPPAISRLLMILYVYGAAGPLAPLSGATIRLDNDYEHIVDLQGVDGAAMVLLELYRRNGEWKVRALDEISSYGLAALGRRMGVTIDDQPPGRRASSENGSMGVRSGEPFATGSAFAVSETHLLTCAHVVEESERTVIRSLAGRHPVSVVVCDRHNDLVLLRCSNTPPLQPLPLRSGSGCQLGESITSLGFPLAGIAGQGVQVTQGNVASLFGPEDDCRWLQFTAPIQPGSSGGPLLDDHGLVTGMVAASMRNTQNMNYAVKIELVLAFLDAAGVDGDRRAANQGVSISASDAVRNHRAALWCVECHR